MASPLKTPDTSGKHCPRCGGSAAVRIVYGYPTAEFERRVSDGDLKGKVVLGGCIVGAGFPTLHCNDCEFEWTPEPRLGRAGSGHVAG